MVTTCLCHSGSTHDKGLDLMLLDVFTIKSKQTAIQ
jgi:hypothetical protein